LRISNARIVADLRTASRRGDRTALALAVDQMRTLALSPRYWEKYLDLLRHPLARLVDLLVIKQGERIAHQKGWKVRRTDPAKSHGKRGKPAPAARGSGARRPRRREPAAAAVQPSLFE
jgi:hypothetical protein